MKAGKIELNDQFDVGFSDSIKSGHDQITESIKESYEKIIRDNNLNPVLYDPVIETKESEDGNTITVTVSMRLKLEKEFYSSEE